jgi:hypothetical protein
VHSSLSLGHSAWLHCWSWQLKYACAAHEGRELSVGGSCAARTACQPALFTVDSGLMPTNTIFINQSFMTLTATRASPSTSPRPPARGSTPSRGSSPNSPNGDSSAVSFDVSSTSKPPSTASSSRPTMIPNPSPGPPTQTKSSPLSDEAPSVRFHPLADC